MRVADSYHLPSSSFVHQAIAMGRLLMSIEDISFEAAAEMIAERPYFSSVDSPTGTLQPLLNAPKLARAMREAVGVGDRD